MKFIENMKDKLKSKKFDQISIALVALLGVSAIFSAVMISSNNGLDRTQITPPVVDNGDDIVVDGDNQESETDETVVTSTEANRSEKVLLPLASENPEKTVAFLSTSAKDLTQPMYKMIKQGDSYYTSESAGVTYKTEDNEPANVVASLSGTVESINEDLISGTVVTIKHENNVKTTYIGVHDLAVSAGTEVKQGDVLGQTGLSQLSSGEPNVIHFEITKDDKNVNPEEALNKSVNEL